MKDLLALQSIEFAEGKKTESILAQQGTLRKKIPQSILTHYERMLKRGKKGVAIARNGVCSECHIGIAVGRLANLASTPGEVHLCANCGRYLYLPEVTQAG